MMTIPSDLLNFPADVPCVLASGLHAGHLTYFVLDTGGHDCRLYSEGSGELYGRSAESGN